MADIVENKHDFTTSWGDSDPVGITTEPDNLEDRNRDGGSVPTSGVSNKFDVKGGGWGDKDPNGITTEPDNHEDREYDGSGVPNVDQGEKMNLTMGLEPNKFPRETGHDSLSSDEAVLS